MERQIEEREYGADRDRRRRARQRRREQQVRRIRMGILCGLVVATVAIALQFIPGGDKGKLQSKGETHAEGGKDAKETSGKAKGKKESILKTMDVKNLSQKDVNAIQKTKEWNQILSDTQGYSQDMRDGLKRNPETIQFLVGYPKAERKVNGGITEEEKQEDFPLFIQWDQRWGYVNYGSDVIGIAGCGPTCMSMVIFGLTRDEKATPDAIAQFSMDNGYYVPGTGTSWTLMTDAASQYGLTAEQISFSEDEMKAELDQGHPLVVSVGPGDFTDQGHFIVLTGYTPEGFTVNDPFSYANSKKTWSYERIYDQMMGVWTYYK